MAKSTGPDSGQSRCLYFFHLIILSIQIQAATHAQAQVSVCVCVYVESLRLFCVQLSPHYHSDSGRLLIPSASVPTGRLSLRLDPA